jgi:enterobactin synthetase component F
MKIQPNGSDDRPQLFPFAGVPSTLQQWVRLQSAAQPQADALWYRGGSLSYGELQDRIDRMARYLSQCGARENSVIGVALGVGEELVVTLLAILECGAAFLPLDAWHPLDRLAAMLADADTTILITHNYLFDRFDGLLKARGGFVLRIEDEAPSIAQQSAEPLTKTIGSDGLAYVMYTSGSTGRPKGVEITHGALINKVAHVGAWGAVDSTVRGALISSIIFDAALAQIFLPLTHGGCVVLIDHDERLQAHDLWRTLARAKTTHIDATPSWISTMLDIAQPAPSWQPQRVILGGESLPPRLIARLRRLWPDAVIVNAYGPTETCIDAACFEIQPRMDISTLHHAVPIGSALPNYRLYVLDAERLPVPAGKNGELYIAGPALSRGYRKRPQQTNERFIDDPFVRGEKMYRSGDEVKLRDDGLLEFVGRCDDQIKIRGQRIEIGEIEAILAQHEAVRAVAVALVESHLTAFVVSADRASLDAVQMFAREKLPSAMQPQRWIPIESLPLTPTGKLDRKALIGLSKAARPERGEQGREVPIMQNRVEFTLQQLWSEFLEQPLSHIDRMANFFELGGQSLMAAQLMAEINRIFETELGLATLFNYSTLADLAVAVQRGERGGETSGLLTLGRGPGQPMFCVPPLGGVGTVYVGLANALSSHCSMYALQAIDLPRAQINMEILAAHFIARMRAMQPRGPYRLLSYSAGGAVALAMCEQLAARGDVVSDLILIDPYHWCPDDLQAAGKDNPEEMFWQVCREMLGEALDIRDAAADRAMPLVREVWRQVFAVDQRKHAFDADTHARAQAVLPKRCDLSVLALLIEGVHNNWSAYCGHQPKPLSFPVKNIRMIQPDTDALDKREQRVAQWRALTGGHLMAHLAPGTHHTMLSTSITLEAIAACIQAIAANN